MGAHTPENWYQSWHGQPGEVLAGAPPARRTARETHEMTELKPEADPAEVGLDPDRLRRIDRHFARYVDDGRLPGWLITVSRHGRLAHVSWHGSRDLEA